MYLKVANFHNFVRKMIKIEKINKSKLFAISCLTVCLLLGGCADFQGEQLGGLLSVNCEPENKGTMTVLAPVMGECDAVISKLNVDEAASCIKRQFHFMTTDEMKAAPGGYLLLSSPEYGWSATLGTHYMMKQAIDSKRGGFIQAEITKRRSGSIIDINAAMIFEKGDDLVQAKKDANATAIAFRKRIIATLGK